MTLLASSEKNTIQNRPYQVRAWTNMVDFTKQRLRQTLGNPKNIDLWTTMTINMTTGSGKTFTVGEYLRRLYLLRNKFERITNAQIPIRVLVLNDRINLVDQLETDLIEGRDGKPPLLGKDIKKHATIKLFHSAADSTGNIKVKDEVKVEGTGKDTVYFSTFGSAGKFDAEDIAWDIIVIDEGQHLKAETYKATLMHEIQKSEKGNGGRTPLVIPMTGTLDPISDMVNDPVVHYGLAEYIASPYSPEVEYNLVTSADFTADMLKEVYQKIQKIGELKDFREKKRQIEEMRISIEEHLAKFGGLTELVGDILTRLDSLDHTIIFASSIDEVNEITKEINQQTGADTAIALHSKIDEADEDVLNAYRDGKRKIIVAVDKLNEGIDLPHTKNVVFWRDVKSPTVFQQQFGRGMRGDKVRYFDYTGVLRNMAWIQGLNQEIIDLPEEFIDKDPDAEGEITGDRPRRGISVLFGDIKKANFEHQISLENVIAELQKVEDGNVIRREDVVEYFVSQGGVNFRKEVNRETKIGLSLFGVGVLAMSRALGISGNCIIHKNVWYDMLEVIYNCKILREEKEEREEITKDQIIERFTSQGDLEYRKKKNRPRRRKMKIKGNGYMRIATLLGITGNEGDYIEVGNIDSWYDMLEVIYDVKIEREAKEKREDITKDEVIEWFVSQGDINYWKELTKSQRENIKIRGNGPIGLATLLGISGSPVSNKDAWYDMLEVIYGAKIKRVEKTVLTKDKIVDYFTKQGDVNFWKNKSRDEKRAIVIEGNTMAVLAGLLGVSGHPIRNLDAWYDMLEIIYKTTIERGEKEEKVDMTKAQVISWFINQGDLNYRRGKPRGKKLKIQGNGLIRIATILGVKGDPTMDINVWYEMLNVIYGENDSQKP